MTIHRTTRVRLALAAVAATITLIGSACSSDDVANKALKDAGVKDVNINTGGLPANFPKDVPTPALKLETGVQAGKQFILRLTSPDAVADLAAYKKVLTDAGFTISREADNSASAGNVSFVATGKGYSVTASAFTDQAQDGGKYMGVVVEAQ